MAPLVSDALEAYAARHSTAPHPVYERLRERTRAAMEQAGMQVGPVEGRLLTLLARLVGARRALEIGTFTGYSALAIAEGLAEGGTLITCDVDPVATALARDAWAEAPWGDRIALRLGPALETLQGLEGPLDLVFIDADKPSYTAYWEAVVPKVRPGGIVVVDNVLWSGRVLAPERESDHAIVAFNAHVRGDARVEHVMLTVRDGVMLAIKR